MLFSKKNAGKWVASKNGKYIDACRNLNRLMKKVDARKDRTQIRFDLVPPHDYFVGTTLHGV